MQKIIITVHAEQDEYENGLQLETAYEGTPEELVDVLAKAIMEDSYLKMLVSRALYIVDDNEIQIEEPVEDLVDIFSRYDNEKH